MGVVSSKMRRGKRFNEKLWAALLALLFGLFLMDSCKPKRYSDMYIEDNRFGTPKIYRDTLASDKKKVDSVKKYKRNVFFGIKSKKAFTKQVKGKNVTYELFFVLKKPQPPQPYVKDIYWLDKKKRVIRVGPIPEKEAQNARILHGPYRKVLNRRTILEGVFYLGARHGRWAEYLPGDDMILTEKTKWYKGYPKDSEISYWDVEKTQIKEAKPIINGELHGEYARYSQKGVLLESGVFQHGVKIGIWREYFEERRRSKRSIQYANTAFETDFKPYVISEFDVAGNLIYDKETEDKNRQAKKPFKEAPIPPIARPADTVKTAFKRVGLLKADSLRRSDTKGK